MNVHNFKSMVSSARGSLANELEEDMDGDEEEDRVGALTEEVDGEEDEGEQQFNEAGDAIEAFNLRNERDGGTFDDNMNYTFKKERGEVDAWVAEMDEVAMEQAIGEAQRAVKRKALEREQEELREAKKVFKPSLQLKKELLLLMQPKEKVSGTMRRLSPNQGKNVILL
jgi:CD2 antigen cytoplasmic tail-binding protein 2